ncbi:helix-turn-helix transcriptional regulator [Psittacicella hinzii]|nr:helix-turn-helix domain-containing protein [Psittacicella hinzii]
MDRLDVLEFNVISSIKEKMLEKHVEKKIDKLQEIQATHRDKLDDLIYKVNKLLLILNEVHIGKVHLSKSYTVREVAQMLGVPYPTFIKRIYSGKYKQPQKINRVYYYYADDISLLKLQTEEMQGHGKLPSTRKNFKS